MDEVFLIQIEFWAFVFASKIAPFKNDIVSAQQHALMALLPRVSHSLNLLKDLNN